MEVSHYKISNIDVNSGKVEFYDTLTKKGALSYDIVVCTFSSKLAMYMKRLEETDIVELPSNKITGIVGFKIDPDHCVNSYVNN